MLNITKRDGVTEPLDTSKLTARLARLADGLDVDPARVVSTVQAGVFAGVSSLELDTLLAETAAALATEHPDYALLGGRVAATALHRTTRDSFAAAMRALHAYVHPRTGRASPLVSDATMAAVERHAAVWDAAVDYTRDLRFSYFGFKTLERSYLLRLDGAVAERPQQLFMRVSVGLHGDDVPAALATYEHLSRGLFAHASPTLFNSGTPRPQLSSCFLLALQEDSIEGIYGTLAQVARISKCAGGIGLAISTLRASGSYIAGTNGTSNGLVPMLRVFDATARYVDQGGNKRPGAVAVYLEPWHADVFDFLDLKKNTGAEAARARDLFYALWVPDLLMRRVEADGPWTLMCPHECPGLADAWGPAFEALYVQYEQAGKGRRTVRAQELWYAIVDAQISTGNPYMLYKDACNAKSNQQHLGTIKSSNLCTEIVEYTAPDEVAVCNLGSLALPAFVVVDTGSFDFAALHAATKVLARNLDTIIDVTYYPVPEARRSNTQHRPVGLGVQGLADTFALLQLPFASPAAKQLNRDIFETIYHAALEQSIELAAAHGPYPSYAGSPASRGLLQFDLWGAQAPSPSGRWDWAALKARLAVHGLRNSLLVAPMPTASTAQILGNTESVEPFTSNLYARRVLAGEFQVVNRHLVRDLAARGLWDADLRAELLAHSGSVQRIARVPADLRERYRTVWEIAQRDLIDMAADRGAYVDQSQSFSVHLAEPTYARMTSMHFYAWKKGLKTGMYYLRSKPAADAIKFTVDPAAVARARAAASGALHASDDEEQNPGAAKAQEASDEAAAARLVCSRENREACTMCSA